MRAFSRELPHETSHGVRLFSELATRVLDPGSDRHAHKSISTIKAGFWAFYIEVFLLALNQTQMWTTSFRLGIHVAWYFELSYRMGRMDPAAASTRSRPAHPEGIDFDDTKRNKLLRLADLSTADHALVHALQRDVIAPDADRIVSEFYLRMRQQPEFNDILATDSSRAESLKSAYRRYLLSFGVRFDSNAYVQERLRIGATHAAVGVPLSLFLTTSRILEQLIVGRVLSSGLDKARLQALLGVVLKVMALDTALAAETYHGSRVGALTESVEALRSRGEKLMHDLSTDGLTGAASRRSVLQILDAALHAARRDARPMGIIIVDLDHFKQINDRYGHPRCAPLTRSAATVAKSS